MRLGLLTATVFLLPFAALPAQRPAKPTTLPGVRGRAMGLSFSPDGKLIAGLCDISEHRVKDGKKTLVVKGVELHLWDAKSGKKLRTIDLAAGGHYGTRRPVFGPGGSTVAVANTKEVQVFDTKTGELKYTLKGGFEGASRLSAFSKDGKTIAGGAWGLEGVQVAVWAPPEEKPLHTFAKKKGQFGGLGLSADGKVLAVSWREGATDAKPAITLIDTKTGKEGRTIPIDELNADEVALSLDGRTIAAQVSHRAVLYDAKTGKPRHAFDDIVRAFAFTASGKTLVGMGQTRRLRPMTPPVMQFYFYNVQTGKKQTFLAVGPADVAAFALSPDGKSLVVAGGADVNDAREVVLVKVTGVK